jgi:hypothetical protein
VGDLWFLRLLLLETRRRASHEMMPRYEMKDALRAFAADLAEHGRLAGQFYTVNKGSLGVDASWGETIIAGVSAGAGTTEQALSVAVVRPAVGTLRISRTCPGLRQRAGHQWFYCRYSGSLPPGD